MVCQCAGNIGSVLKKCTCCGQLMKSYIMVFDCNCKWNKNKTCALQKMFVVSYSYDFLRKRKSGSRTHGGSVQPAHATAQVLVAQTSRPANGSTALRLFLILKSQGEITSLSQMSNLFMFGIKLHKKEDHEDPPRLPAVLCRNAIFRLKIVS